jgi:hypothetical protein
VEQIEDVIEEGDFDWLGFYFPDYIADLDVFGRQILPQLVAKGIGLSHSPKPSFAPGGASPPGRRWS